MNHQLGYFITLRIIFLGEPTQDDCELLIVTGISILARRSNRLSIDQGRRMNRERDFLSDLNGISGI